MTTTATTTTNGRTKLRKYNQLSSKQRVQLTMKLAASLAEFKANSVSIERAAESLQRELGFQVTANNVETILLGMEEELNPHRGLGQSRPGQAARMKSYHAITRAVQALGTTVRSLCNQLGCPELVRLLEPLESQDFKDTLEYYGVWASKQAKENLHV